MIVANINDLTGPAFVAAKVRAYWELLKFRLSFLVAFSCGFGYVLASPQVNWVTLAMLFLGGFLLSGSSVIINQIIEKDLDSLMTRTMNRPLPTYRVSVNEATSVAVFCLLAGVTILMLYTNRFNDHLVDRIDDIVWICLHTIKAGRARLQYLLVQYQVRFHLLLGWVAATGSISHEAWIIFGIQFIWQFPHFWAIAWVSDDDYKKAGFKLLPSGGKKDLNTAMQIMIYTMFFIPLGLLPATFGITGLNSAIVVTVCGVLFFAQTFSLMRSGDRKSALKIMFGSFLYLPIVQIAYLLDKV